MVLSVSYTFVYCVFNLGQPDCASLTPPTHSVMTVTGLNFGNTTSFVCNAPYNLVGSAVRTCEINGQWSGVQPTCSRESIRAGKKSFIFHVGVLSDKTAAYRAILHNKSLTVALNTDDENTCPQMIR